MGGVSGRLHAVPQAAPRVLALIRVSKEREGMVSPELQDTAISDYCARRGMRITARMEGLDESGSGSRSRWWARLDAAVGMVEDGVIDVIVVWKFSRTARNRLKWAVALDRVEAAGGRLESATEQVDVSTSTGRFTRGMLAELNAFEAERIGEVWKETHARRRSQGLPHDGRPRVGYVYERDGYRPDPAAAPIVTELYRRYVDGQGLRSLAAWLTSVGVSSGRGARGHWSTPGVSYLLAGGFAAGFLYVHDPACRCAGQAKGGCRRRVHVRGAHDPIVTARLWEEYRRERARRAVTPARLLAPTTPLAGLVRCGACGYAMHFKVRAEGSHYRCSTPGCPRPTSLGLLKAERAVREWLRAYVDEVEQQAAAAVAERTQRTAAKAATTRLARSVNRVDAEMAELTRQLTRGIVPESAYVAARDELLAERAVAAAELESLTRAPAAVRPPRAVVAGALADWDLRPTADLNAVLRELLVVVVTRGVSRSVVAVFGSWEPVGLGPRTR